MHPVNALCCGAKMPKWSERRSASGTAGYGDRTRLTGLGSQDITTMLSPHVADHIKRAGLDFYRNTLIGM